MLYNYPLSNSSPVSSSKPAMLHLLLHCCTVDGECDETEVQTVFSIMSNLYQVDDDWLMVNTATYYRYAARTRHHPSYLPFLLRQINTSDPEALLWYCAQVTVADGVVSFAEELLFERLAALLRISPERIKAVHRMAWQLRLNKQDVSTESVGAKVPGND